MRTSETTLREIYDISNKEVKEKMELEFPTLFKKSSILNEAISYLTEEDEEVNAMWDHLDLVEAMSEEDPSDDEEE